MEKIVDFLRADGNKMKNVAIFRRFRKILGAINASAEGASEKFRALYRKTTYDVIIFKFQEGAFAPSCPTLLTPMSEAPFKREALSYM